MSVDRVLETPDVAHHRAAVLKALSHGSALDRAAIFMNALAAVIACYGLLANSVVVIIGAMIVAVLMNPILGLALSVVENDLGLFRTAGVSLASGVGVVYGAALLIGLMYRAIPITSEIMSRTTASSFDLMIAIAGGAAGAYASVSPRLSGAFIGVVIATALVPPLAASGLLLARGETALALGALLLAFTNMVAVQFAASLVMWAAGFRAITRISRSVSGFILRDAPSILVVLGLAVIMTWNFRQVVSRQVFETGTRGVLLQQVGALPGADLVDVGFDEVSPDHMLVLAVMRAPSPPTAQQVAAIEAGLPQAPNGQRLELRIRYVSVMEIGRSGTLR